MHKVIIDDLISIPAVLKCLLFCGLMALGVACSIPNNKLVRPTVSLYTFGDAGFERQLSEGRHPIKQGPIAVDQIPEEFPKKFLESDGCYAGGRVFSSIAEAQQAVLEARRNGVISEEGEWGIYQLDGDWEIDVYEVRPKEYHLKRSTTVRKRVY